MPAFVQVDSSICCAGVPLMTTWQECAQYALAVMFLCTAGALHIPMKEDLIRMVPRIFPYPRLLMYVTGGFEVLGAIGLLIPATRSVAGFCLAALLITMFPANINAAIKHISLRGQSPTVVLATYHIRPLNQAFKSTFHVARSLPIPQRKSTIEMLSSTHLQKG
jgi:uncharacterized membrane protein